MWTDIVDIRDFYESQLGIVARRMIRRRVREFWPDVTGMRVLGLGFATPYLRPLMDEADRTIAAMPAQQGVLHWPADADGLTVLTDEMELPFDDLSIDRVLLVHGLESAEPVRPLLREIWRVLSGSGRLLIVTPNRRGVWSRLERTPFGQGRPYSRRQLSNLLRDTMFTPLQTETALFVPPVRSRMVLSSSAAWERVGHAAFSRFGGVLLSEATKQIYAGQPVAQKARRRYAVATQGTPGGNSRVVDPTINPNGPKVAARSSRDAGIRLIK
ncbi:MAG: methyltransferase domain-containing protein [Rhodospirillales bacterium]|jgi:SAM-dependent methyltransferase|nr:methyltransferase domain-containing protein [Rhodospirillales bacterium]MBT4041034.1 methyltransferase domain-containing protein [Rhodospirillales bacterium]MBT4625277.1 methyltransferase domain-containing protein [Rhodospirillales bacterium]MBT5352550.1 methyltransferase domain-containing protein [Rhodospirillales bacterium]MBT6111929.1 methyltransferase domain-containing protein [Rhodospirillales bacterium]